MMMGEWRTSLEEKLSKDTGLDWAGMPLPHPTDLGPATGRGHIHGGQAQAIPLNWRVTKFRDPRLMRCVIRRAGREVKRLQMGWELWR